MVRKTEDRVRFALPKGRMGQAVAQLLGDAGVDTRIGLRDYRPAVDLAGWEAKLLKPQSIVGMVASGSRDLGFTGRDWIVELGAQDRVVEVLDTGLDPVRLVAAMPASLYAGEIPRDRTLIVASEYRNIAEDWVRRRELNATFVQSWGATEVLPPEDADCIIDNTATGSTLRANGLEIVDEILRSSTRLVASPEALEDPYRRDQIECLVLLLRSVLDARERVMLEVNVDAARLDRIVQLVPSMREPTISPLASEGGFAVKAAVPRRSLPTLIPELRAAGGTDVVVSRLEQIIP